MLYKYIIENYKEAEPIFFSDINVEGISKPALNQQLATLCKNGKLAKYDKGIYYLPKKTAMHSTVGPSADMVARYRFVIRKGEIVGYYTGNAFANQIGISTQVPRVVEIVSNNTNSSPREVEIGNRIFYVRKPIEDINGENVYVLQMLDLLKDLDDYLDYGYEDARKRFSDYIHKHGIKRMDVDKYIRKFQPEYLRTFMNWRWTMYLHTEDRNLFRDVIQLTSQKLNVSEDIVEKDYYVTLILYELSKSNFPIVFKGGTALSKAFHVIDRFSEDIDITFSEHIGESRRKKLKDKRLRQLEFEEE